jgi:hypothetical protein
MDGIGNNRFVSSPFASTESAPTAPPPPSEVKVRTMRGDLESMAKSGGGVPRFQSVKVEGLSLGKKLEERVGGAKGKSNAILILAALLGVVMLALLGYLAYRYFFAGNQTSSPPTAVQSNTPPASQNQGQSQATPPQTTGAPPPTALVVHASLFKEPADQTLTLTLSSGGAASNAADLQTFNQKLNTLLASANKTASVIEINVKGTGGQDLGVSDILAQANAAVLDPTFLAAHFSPDATFFVYHDKNGFWPGYVLALKPTENWLFLKNDVAKLETSPSLSNFFLANPGAASEDGFTDSAVSGAAVRILPFIGPGAPPYFTYGWFQTYLLFSTSQNGFAQAVSRLK